MYDWYGSAGLSDLLGIQNMCNPIATVLRHDATVTVRLAAEMERVWVS